MVTHLRIVCYSYFSPVQIPDPGSKYEPILNLRHHVSYRKSLDGKKEVTFLSSCEKWGGTIETATL